MKIKLLIVEDDIELRTLVVSSLKDLYDFDFYEANHGLDALDIFYTHL